MTEKKLAIIIGAGPAGLTAAIEFLRRTDIKPIVLEATNSIGGLSRTVRYNGNRMDIGGHRFFSKSDRVMQWWLDMLPLDPGADLHTTIAYQNQSRTLPHTPDQTPAASSHSDDLVMLIRQRKSRIYYLRRFFDYPITLSISTLRKLGFVRVLKIGLSYIHSRLKKISPESSLQDFLINRFGRELYLTFFKSYTEKVWGAPCSQISAQWGAQRIKSLSLTSALRHFLKKKFSSIAPRDLAQKSTDTSLIERFLYPKFGPGQLWEHVADQIITLGGEVHLSTPVNSIHVNATEIWAVSATNPSGINCTYAGDYFLSTMPVCDLINALDVTVPPNIKQISDGLQYRDFIVVGLLVNRLSVTEANGGPVRDTWIYIQEPDVLLGRLQIFNNWSPYMVADPTKIWIGLEYFCRETDDLWKLSDDALKNFAAQELQKIGILNASEVIDGHVERVPKTYPAYFGTYNRFDEIRHYTDVFRNLFLVGRNGMHKYNNQDHSMLTAMTAVDNIIAANFDKSSLWSINTEQEYHEHKPSR